MPCLHVYGFVCICRHFIAVTKLYASTRIRIFLRFRPSTCIRIRSEFDIKIFESFIEHAVIPWQRFTWVGDFRTFTSSFSKRSGYMRQHVTRFVAFSKVSTLESVFKSLRLRCAFRRIRADESRIRNKMFADTNESGYVWTGLWFFNVWPNSCKFKQPPSPQQDNRKIIRSIKAN